MIGYRNLSQSDYHEILSTFLPARFAEVIADAETHAAQGALDDGSHTLSRMIGRPTTSLEEAVAFALMTPPAPH